MNWADWAIVVIFGVSSLIGLVRGLIKEALSLVVWAGAFFVAAHFKQPAATLLEHTIATPSLREMAAFGLLFLLTLLLGSLLNYLIAQLVKMTGLSGTDRVLGMVFGAVRGILVVMAIVIFLPPLVPIDKDNWWHQSLLIPQFVNFEDSARIVFAELSKLFGKLFS